MKLACSTYADRRCKSWVKDKFGRITANRVGGAIQYQERVGKSVCKGHVRETLISDRMLAVGAALSMTLVLSVRCFPLARR